MQDQDVREADTREGELFDAVVRHIGEFVEADVSYLKPDSQLSSSIDGMSSLKLVELLLYLEDCFNLEFDSAMVEGLDTLSELVRYIRALQDARA
jgi:acyl carrier protein